MPSNNYNGRNFKTELTSNGYPDLNPHWEKILIIVKATPAPSRQYGETVCTVGITEKGKLIRLYPIDYRYMNFRQWYKKYQWITAKIEKNKKDFRIDSYRPEVKTIRPIGNPLPAGKWEERKRIILPLISSHLEEIQNNYKNKGISLGIFKPKEIQFFAEKESEVWAENKQKILRQQVLIGTQTKNLEKIPYKFSYKFKCDNDDCKGHAQKIIDWEIYELYRNLKQQYPYSPDVILEKIKQLWQGKMWGDDRDSYLIVGTQYPKPSFLVLGVFWPPKS